MSRKVFPRPRCPMFKKTSKYPYCVSTVYSNKNPQLFHLLFLQWLPSVAPLAWSQPVLLSVPVTVTNDSSNANGIVDVLLLSLLCPRDKPQKVQTPQQTG